MATQELIEEVATAIEQCGWEDVDVFQMNEVMAIAALRAVYFALIEHARQANDESIIRWLAASPIGTIIVQN
ncbi:hypothetical protein ACWGNA_27620 [Brucella cytisi]|uniref:hypothetical protein n=1 Tax=Brucella cytisi TaxID=407152 RepID=UPI0035D6F429